MNNTIKLIISIAIPLAVGALGSYFTATSVSGWYQTINKPSWNPPNAVFAPVWTTLYILMGIALYLVWKSGNSSVAITLFAIQLILNFFGQSFFLPASNWMGISRNGIAVYINIADNFCLCAVQYNGNLAIGSLHLLGKFCHDPQF